MEINVLDNEVIEKEIETVNQHIPGDKYHDLIDDIVIESGQNENKETALQGRRIIDLIYFNKKLKEISGHSSLFNCGLHAMTLIGEKKLVCVPISNIDTICAKKSLLLIRKIRPIRKILTSTLRQQQELFHLGLVIRNLKKFSRL